MVRCRAVDARGLARMHGLGRVAFGLGLLLAPERLAGPWLGSQARSPGAKVALAGLGARDLGIGLGAAWAAGAGTEVRPWILAGVLADAADCTATIRHRRSLPALGVVGVGALAAGSAAFGAWLALGAD